MPIQTAFLPAPVAYNPDGVGLSLGPFENAVSAIFIIDKKGPAIIQTAREDAYSGKASWDSSSEITLSATTAGYDNVRGVRFKLADPANIPICYAVLFFKGDAIPQGLVPYDLSLSTGGAIVAGARTGEVSIFAGTVAPSGSVMCDGSHYDGTNALYTALWGICGIKYGGTAQSDFAVPDLRGRVVVGTSPGGKVLVDTIAKNDGVTQVLRSISHRHTAVVASTPVTAAGAAWSNPNAGNTSGDVDNLNNPAFLVLNYVIWL